MSLKPSPRQRVLLDEPELCNLLKKARRPGTANITEILLSLFDGDDYSPRTRNKPITVEQPFFSIVTASTPENLEMSMLDNDIESGLMPRFAFFYCNPREPIAYPPPPDLTVLKLLARELEDIERYAHDLGAKNPVIVLSPEAMRDWEFTFNEMMVMTRKEQGLAPALMARVPSLVMKFALIYAIQSKHSRIETDDLARATLVGTYLMETARIVPSLVIKTRVARIEAKIIESLEKMSPSFLTPNQIHRMVSGRVKADELRRSLHALYELGVITGVGGEEYGPPMAYRILKEQ